MAVDRMPLMWQNTDRGVGQAVGGKDSRIINAFVEDVANAKDEVEMYVVKRPGLLEVRDLADGEGRGIFDYLNVEYAVVGNTVYVDGVAATGTLSTATGKVSFDFADETNRRLLISDGVNLYFIDDGTTTLNTVADPDVPSPHKPHITVFDQYCFLANEFAEIHNSAVGDCQTWNLEFIVAETRADRLQALTRQVNYLVGFGDETIELFFDAGNITGTPLARYEGSVTQFGVPEDSGHCVVTIGNHVYFVGQNQGGGRFVARLTGGFTAEKVSTSSVDEALDAEGTAISSAFAFPIRIMGRTFYVLQLSTTDKTFVFDEDLAYWSEWTDGAGNHWPYIGTAEIDGQVRLLHETTGQVVRMDEDTYQDLGANFTVNIQTRKYDGGTKQQKFMHRLQLVGDVQTSTTNLGVAWSDDDYQSFTTPRNLDMGSEGSRLTRLGTFKRRAFQLTHTDNAPMRLQALEFNLTRGHYSR